MLIYTDGACKGNGKDTDAAGGYGVFMDDGRGNVRHIWGGESATTNNRMELMAAIVALKNAPKNMPLDIYTDSNYVQKGISEWVSGWKKRGWKKADGKPVLNQELWQQLDELNSPQVRWHWVKGHNGEYGNEMADMLANRGVGGFGDEYVQGDAQGFFAPLLPTPDDDLSSNDLSNNPSKADYTPAFDHQAVNQMTNDHFTDHIFVANSLDDRPDHDFLNQHHASNTLDNHSFSANFDKHSNDNTPVYDGDTSRFNPYFVPILPTPINQGKPERQLIMDTETTGFEDQNGDRIVEVGMIELIGRKFTGEKLHVYLNPDKQMDDEVIRVHGISNEFLVDKPRFGEVAAQIYEFIKGAQLVAHNASFDMRFLNMEFKKAGFDDLNNQVTVLDTLALAKQMYPGQKNSLDALVKRLNVGKQDRTFHGALLDSEILAEVYLAMTGGQVALAIDEHIQDDDEVYHDENLAHLAHLLVRTISDDAGDRAWRQAHIKA